MEQDDVVGMVRKQRWMFRVAMCWIAWSLAAALAANGQAFSDPGLSSPQSLERRSWLAEGNSVVQEAEGSVFLSTRELGENIKVTIDEALDPGVLTDPLTLVEEEESLFKRRHSGNLGQEPGLRMRSDGPPMGSGLNALYLIAAVGFALICMLGVVIWIAEHGAAPDSRRSFAHQPCRRTVPTDCS